MADEEAFQTEAIQDLQNRSIFHLLCDHSVLRNTKVSLLCLQRLLECCPFVLA